MKIYLVVGAEMHESVSAVLKKNGFEIIGHEYTIDASLVMLKKRPLSPDLFIINGLAQASGAAEGTINRNRSMLVKLRDIRMTAPKSRILLLLPGENPPELIRGAVSLGIYDIRQASRFDGPALLDWIRTPMSIADFGEFRIARVPGGDAGDIVHSVGLRAGRDRDLKDRGEHCGGGAGGEGPARKRSGKPVSILGVGDARIEEWIRESFSDRLEVLAALSEHEEIKQRVCEVHPDICIFMRQSAIGGIPGAGELAAWAVSRVPAVLFIAGELSESGRAMVEQAAKAGVRHIISCEEGGFISGNELVYVLDNIIREMQVGTADEKRGIHSAKEAAKTADSILRGVNVLGRAFLRTVKAENPKGRKLKNKINKREGLSLEEEKLREGPVAVIRNPAAIVPGGILAVVTPWRPNLAGRLAAQAVRILSEVEGSEVAYVGASKCSTGALWLDVSGEELMMSDWRVPGSSYPITQENIKIYAVDPAKDLPVTGDAGLWDIVKQARKTATYMVVDFAGDTAEVLKAAHQGRAVVLAVLPGNDPVEYRMASLWFSNFAEGKQNVVAGIDLRGSPNGIPEGLRPKVAIRNNPADSLALVLKKNNDNEFSWI